jgi:hypothetical protein
MKCLMCNEIYLIDPGYFYGASGDEKIYKCVNTKCYGFRLNSVLLKDNWWFAYSYQSYFDFKGMKYFVCSHPEDETNFYINKYKTGLEKILSIPHYGLPVNDDYDREINKLVERFKKVICLE